MVGNGKPCGKTLKSEIDLMRLRLHEYYSVAVTSRKGKAIHTIYGIIRTDMVKTRVEPPAQNNVPKTIYEYIIHRQQSSMP